MKQFIITLTPRSMLADDKEFVVHASDILEALRHNCTLTSYAPLRVRAIEEVPADAVLEQPAFETATPMDMHDFTIHIASQTDIFKS